MNPWQCCRTCLSEHSLNPIFPIREKCEMYTNAILTAIGLKINPDDDLPQLMCTQCIILLNQINEFRNKCKDSYKQLQKRLCYKDFSRKTDNLKCETENYYTININNVHLDSHIDDFSDNEDNIPLDLLQINSKQENTDSDTKNFIAKVENHEDSSETKVVKRKKKKQECGSEKKPKVKVKERIECEHCHKILTSRTSLRNHYKIHIGFDVVCEHCGKKFITKRLLLMHCKAKHGYEKTDKCSFCDYTASNAEQVKIHERLHTGEKPYNCGECNAGFHRKSSYLQHVAIHLPEKTVQCDQCPLFFKSATLMRIHRSRHRPPTHKFVCTLCECAFVRRRNAIRHVTRAHRIVASSEDVRKVAVVNS